MAALVVKPRALLFFSLAVGMALAFSLVLFWARPAAAQEDPYVVRGRYLATAGPCVECHTQRKTGDPTKFDTTKLLAGGVAFRNGEVYSANITSDATTGIGSWTIAQIVSALDQGVSKDGRKLVVMPWEHFRGLATTDKVALAIYLKSTAAVSNPVPAAALTVSRDKLYDVAASAAFAIGPGSPPAASDALATGQYLALNALGCAGCHGAALSGGWVGPFWAPNITPDTNTGIGAWTEAQIATAFTTGVRPDGSTIIPVMPYGAAAYGNLTAADAAAVAKYVKSVTAVQNSKPAAPPAGDFAVSPLWLAAAGALLLLVGFGVLRLRPRRATR